jgi:uncharacterized protein (TIGR00730 family)
MLYLCVFCGSSVGNQPEYSSMARQLGQTLVQQQLGLVYGGGNIGLMGIIASTVLEAGGEVIGVMPRQLAEQELLHSQLSTTHIVETMHERKSLMAKLSAGFITLPGGFGTLEECCEMLTWAQLKIHEKPCGILNCLGFFDGLLEFLDHQVKQGFVTPKNRALVLEAANPETLLTLMKPQLSIKEVKSKE